MCGRLKQYSGNRTICMTYRQTACAWDHAPPFTGAVDDLNHHDWWLKNNNGTNWLHPGHMWDWRNTRLAKWYVDVATRSLTSMSPSVNGAFFDDFDGSVCGFESAYDTLPSRYSSSDRQEMHRAKMAVFRQVSDKMVSAGQYPVFAMSATFNTSSTPPAYRCNATETSTLAQLGNSGFFRYRIWPFIKALTAERCHGLMEEMARERSEGIEMFFYTIVEVGGKLPDVAVAAFLLSRAHHRYVEVPVEQVALVAMHTRHIVQSTTFNIHAL
eukprot:COSAG02_NODE_15198_length_1194_cov_1.251142_2_plen_269_part_01